MFPRVTHPSAAHPEGRARLACVRPAASVRSEPGSNSQVESSEELSLTSNPCTSFPDQSLDPVTSLLIVLTCVSRQTVKLTLSSSVSLESRYASVKRRIRPNHPHIPSDISQCQKAKETKQPEPRQSLSAVKPHRIQIVFQTFRVKGSLKRPVRFRPSRSACPAVR